MLEVFDYQGQQVRTDYKDEAVWFVAADVCRVLDIINPTMAVGRLDDDEKGLSSMKNKKYYIAYGSNLSVEQMAYRCPDAKIAGQAVLAGWELLFRGCATIAPNPKKNTPVLVWEISERDEGNLDLYEGYPNYYRKEVLNIKLLREGAEPEMVTAMVYIMENDFGHRAPSRYYYKVLHDGYKAFHFPMHILEGALKECMDKDAAQRMIEEVQA